MVENLIPKFLKLMSSNITESDLELVQLGKSLGLDLISFADLRASQEDKFIDDVRKKALLRMKKYGDNFLDNKDLFYAGSIDFMVCSESGKHKFFLLETNGGSNRGLSIITKKQQELMYNGYLNAIMHAIEKRKKSEKIIILVGVPVNDALIHEKVILIEYLRRKIKAMGLKLKIFHSDNYDKEFPAEIIFLIADYRELSKSLTYHKGWIKFNSERVNVLIGDGIARRLNDSIFINELITDLSNIETVIVNPIFMVTDDKSLTYLASYYDKDILEKYHLKYLLFTKAHNERDLHNKLSYLLKTYKKTFIIKPKGGSGGAGVMHVSPDTSENIETIIEKSKEEFFQKFMENRTPFPYTIQEMADFSLIKWKDDNHTFDIRIYLAQNGDQIIPIGGLARIARGSYVGGINKEEFVVNLSGYNGQIEVERGVGFSKKSSKLLNLKPEDFINMFCIGCVLFKSIIKNYYKIVNFSEWDKIFI